MARIRQRELADYRAVLRRRGDFAIGAYARAQQRRRILVALGGLVLIVAAGSLYYLLRPRNPRGEAPTVSVFARCVTEDCGWEGVQRVTPAEARTPLKCPKCGHRSCRQVWQCQNCGNSFVPAPVRPGQSGVACPLCKSKLVGTMEAPPAAEP